MNDDKQKQGSDGTFQDEIKETLKEARETINDTIRETRETVKESIKEDKRNGRRDRYRERDQEWRYQNRVSDGIGVGVTFIFIGVVWMLMKLGYLDFSVIGAFLDLWPLIFIVIGVNIIFKRVPYVGLLTWTLFLSAIVAYGMYFAPNTFDSGINIDFDNAFNENGSVSKNRLGDMKYETKNILMEEHKAVNEAALNLDLGFGEINVGATEKDLLAYSVPNAIVDTKFDYSDTRADFSFENKRDLHLNNNNGVSYDFFLNNEIEWLLNFNMGAGESKLNLDTVKVKSVEINGGAGDFELILGDKQDACDVSVNIGAGDLTLDLPSDVGVKITNQGLFSDSDFSREGLTKMNDAYVNEAFKNSKKLITIDINSAVSNIDIKWH